MPARLWPSARELIATLILMLMCSWDFRFEKPLSEIWLLLLLIVEAPNDVDDPTRRSVANRLLTMSDAELAKECKFTDLPQKLRLWKRGALEAMRDTGKCSCDLFTFILLYRARLPYQNQSREGHIGLMQRIASLGVRARRPGISDRLRNKLGDPITVRACVDLDPEVRAYMYTTEHRQRWLQPVGAVPDEEILQDASGAVTALAKRFESTLINKLFEQSGVRYVWAFEEIKKDARVFLIGWSYFYRYFVGLGKASEESDGLRWHFHEGYPTEMLLELITQTLRTRAEPEEAATLDIWRCTLVWDQLACPLLDISTVKRLRMKPAPPQTRPPRAPAEQPEPGSPEAPGGEGLEGEGEPEGPPEGLQEFPFGDDNPSEAAETDVGDRGDIFVMLDDAGDLLPDPPPGEDDPAGPEREAPPTPGRMPLDDATAATQDAATATVQSLVKLGREECQLAAARAQAKRSETVRAYQDTSLVQTPDGACLFVYWTLLQQSWKGRKVSLTEDTNAVKTIVANRVPELDYSNATMLIPVTGVTQKKARRRPGKHKQCQTG